MAQTFGTDLGGTDDTVKLTIGDDRDVVIAEQWEVQQSVLTQPSTFSIRLGWGPELKGLIDIARPGRRFQLTINGALQQTGAIDGYEATSDGSGGTLTIHGRDALAPLHDAFVDEEISFQNDTYYSMTEKVLLRVIGTHVLSSYNDANRKLTTGIGVKPLADPDVDPQQNASGPTAKQLKTRIGERWYEFLKRELDRAGLFLWAAGDGSFVLSQPNANQVPFYRMLRQRGQTRNAVNVESAHYRNTTEGRYTEAIIYGRGGGKKAGRTKTHGEFFDQEMLDYIDNPRPLILRDVNVTSADQAEFYARRKLAETRRAGWSLSYVLSGCTMPSIATGARAVIGIDTVVSVDDAELGLVGDYYLERVVFRRNPATTTEITLSRLADLVFAQGEAGQ